MYSHVTSMTIMMCSVSITFRSSHVAVCKSTPTPTLWPLPTTNLLFITVDLPLLEFHMHEISQNIISCV